MKTAFLGSLFLLLANCATTPPPDLFVASSRGDLESVRAALKAKIPVNAVSREGASPLMVASYRGHADVVDELIGKGADLQYADPQGQTALHYAALSASPGPCLRLIANHAPLDVLDHDQLSPLMMSSRFGAIECTDALIKAGANVNLGTAGVWPALYFAIARGREDIINLLLEAHASLTYQDQDGWTPLHIAAIYGVHPIYELLKKRGASEKTRDRQNKTPRQLLLETRNSANAAKKTGLRE